MDADRREQVRKVMMSFDVGDARLQALDPDSPAWLEKLMRNITDGYRDGDIDWLLQTDPEIEIVQPPEIPGAGSYRGLDGLAEALLD